MIGINANRLAIIVAIDTALLYLLFSFSLPANLLAVGVGGIIEFSVVASMLFQQVMKVTKDKVATISMLDFQKAQEMIQSGKQIREGFLYMYSKAYKVTIAEADSFQNQNPKEFERRLTLIRPIELERLKEEAQAQNTGVVVQAN